MLRVITMPDLPKDAVRELLARWASGDDAALNQLFPLYFRKVVNLLAKDGDRRHLPDDLVQEVFVHLDQWLKKGHTPPDRLTLYLLASARNLARNKGRIQQLPVADSEEAVVASRELTASQRSIASEIGSKEIRDVLRGSIEKMSPRMKEIYLLRVDGLTEKAIAEKLGIAIGTVKWTLHEGIEQLKADLEDVAKQMSTWYRQREAGKLDAVEVLRALDHIPWLYADPVRLKHFEGMSDPKGAKKLSIKPDTYQARLKVGYELLEAELNAEFPEAFAVMSKDA